MWNLISVCLEMLVSVQDRCTICTKRTIGSEIILDATDGTLGDMAQLEALSIYLESATLDARSVHSLRKMFHMLRNHF
jgi:hypothetical protein